MNLSIGENDFLNCFEHINSLSDLNNKMEIFVMKANANEFDYGLLVNNLIDPMISYALSRKVQEKYKNKAGTLFKKAKEKFKNYEQNDGELGELLLYCFLETHLKAPKILSKMELKTSSKLYINGADGVHYLKLKNGNYQLIFGESKMYKNLGTAIENALESIREFKNEMNGNGEKKSGITFEKSIISDNLDKEFNEEDEEFISKLIYPSSDEFYVDDAFGIFIGYEINVDKEKALSNNEFRKKIKEKINKELSSKLNYISKKIEEKGLNGHCFYLYFVPFTDIDKNRKEILMEVLN